MPPTKKPTRRTRDDIAKLSVDEVTAALVAAGLRPIELVTMTDEIFFAYPQPKLEPWQQFDWMTYAPIATDPFVLDFYTRNPQPDLPTQWRGQLWEHELTTYVEGLSRPALMGQLKVVHVDDWFDKPPQPTWTTTEYRNELTSRIRELETVKPTTNKRRRN